MSPTVETLESVPPSEATIPILPCVDPDEMVEFYGTLGFQVTYRQTRPYLYLALTWRRIDLHFRKPPNGMVVEAEDSGLCLVMVDEVAPYHAAIAAALKQRLGRVPSTGRPRLTRYRPGASRFTLVDPSGNSMIFVQRDEPMKLDYGGSKSLSRMAKALDNARILREFKNDDLAAFRALNSAVRRPKPSDSDTDRAAALAVMIELAPSTGQSRRTGELLAQLRDIPLTAEQWTRVEAHLADPAMVRHLLGNETP